MIKVKCSKSKHLLLLDFINQGGTIAMGDFKRLVSRISRLLLKINTGYTLVEVYGRGTKIDRERIGKIGEIYRLCYGARRIWRVVQVHKNCHPDPGLRILHQTRWKRHVPMIEVSNMKRALDLAMEEVEENSEWVVGTSALEDCSS